MTATQNLVGQTGEIVGPQNYRFLGTVTLDTETSVHLSDVETRNPADPTNYVKHSDSVRFARRTVRSLTVVTR